MSLLKYSTLLPSSLSPLRVSGKLRTFFQAHNKHLPHLSSKLEIMWCWYFVELFGTSVVETYGRLRACVGVVTNRYDGLLK